MQHQEPMQPWEIASELGFVKAQMEDLLDQAQALLSLAPPAIAARATTHWVAQMRMALDPDNGIARKRCAHTVVDTVADLRKVGHNG